MVRILMGSGGAGGFDLLGGDADDEELGGAGGGELGEVAVPRWTIHANDPAFLHQPFDVAGDGGGGETDSMRQIRGAAAVAIGHGEIQKDDEPGQAEAAFLDGVEDIKEKVGFHEVMRIFD